MKRKTILKTRAIKDVIRAVRPNSIPLNSQTRPENANPKTPTAAKTDPKRLLGQKHIEIS